MSNRVNQAKLLTNGAVLEQLTAALMAEAIAVLSEGAAVADHTNRLAYANAIIANPAAAASFMLPALLYNANILAAAGNTPDATGTPLADADVDALVKTVFSFYADHYAAGAQLGVVSLQLGS